MMIKYRKKSGSLIQLIVCLKTRNMAVFVSCCCARVYFSWIYDRNFMILWITFIFFYYRKKYLQQILWALYECFFVCIEWIAYWK